MSYFAEELQRQMLGKNLKQSELAEISGISQAQVSKWLRGEQISVSEDQMSALSAAIGDDAVQHAELLRAHLLDEQKGLGSQLIRIEIDSPHVLSAPKKARTKGEKAMEFLATERHQNRDLNELLIDLARVLGAKLDP
jgi:transcriptional regulator with XRE-family HTH domain